MGCFFSIFRAAVALVLSVVIFVGFALSLLSNNFFDKLLSADFYKNTISAEDTYTRIYEEVLVADELKDKTSELLGGIEVASRSDTTELLREIIPPLYVQEQVEEAIERTIGYMNEDVDYLEAYLDLSRPLGNVKPAVFGYLDREIVNLQAVWPSVNSCSLDGLTDSILPDLADVYVIRFVSIVRGMVPETVPSLELLDPGCRQLLFIEFYDQLMQSPKLPENVSQSLKENREQLRFTFESGDTFKMLKIASRLLIEPLVDEATEEVRRGLKSGDRFDLIQQLGKWDDSSSEAQIRSNISEVRDWISMARNFSGVITLVMVFGGAILMGLVFFPDLSSMVRWPGITLSVTGLFFFVVGKVAVSEVPKRLTDALAIGTGNISGVPVSVVDLSGDILSSFGFQLMGVVSAASLSLVLWGAVLVGGSFATVLVKRFSLFVK